MAVKNPPNSEFQYTDDFDVTEEVKHAFDINGYILIKGLLASKELEILKMVLEKDDGIMANHYSCADGEGEGRTAKMCLWNQPGDDITGLIARSEKVAGTFEKLLGGEVYHYYSKVIMKEAHTGGAHIWHQDYGYWYENGCIFPNMGTAWIAIDKSDRSNGCLKILQGSHHVGRIMHMKKADQAGADLEHLKEVKNFCPLVHVEVNPGDCLFFHCNILHCSEKNDSNRRRWAFLVVYNRADNDPVYEHHHPKYSPLNKVPNSEIAKCSPDFTLEGKDFFLGQKANKMLNKLQERGNKA